MVWPWGSSKPTSEQPTASNASSHSPPAPAQQPSPQFEDQAPPRTLTRDELAELELQAFLQELEADIKPSSTRFNRVPKIPLSESGKTNLSSSGSVHPSQANKTLEDQLLPTEMSCRQAFDAAFYCQSMGGQFNNLYRYGGIRSCSENWGDFWFCMRSRSTGDDEKSRLIREHYKRKALKYKVGPSSEDVWESRDKKLDWGEAFSVPVEAAVGSDEEWNRREKLRREGRVEGTT